MICIEPWSDDPLRIGVSPVPTRWVNLPGRVASSDAVTRAWYRVNGGPSLTFSVGPDGARLERRGDYNIEIDPRELNRGANRVRLTACNAAGDQACRDLVIHLEAGRPGLPLRRRAAECSRVGAFARVVDGQWVLTPSGLRCPQTGYDRLLAFGDLGLADYWLAANMTPHRFDTGHLRYPDIGAGFGIVLRWKGHTDDGLQPRREWRPIGALGWYRYGRDKADTVRDYRLSILGGRLKDDTLNEPLAEDRSGFRIAAGRTYRFKMQVRAAADGRGDYALKVWEAGAPEPADWNLTGRGLAGERSEGAALIVAHHADVTVDDVEVVPLD